MNGTAGQRGLGLGRVWVWVWTAGAELLWEGGPQGLWRPRHGAMGRGAGGSVTQGSKEQVLGLKTEEKGPRTESPGTRCSREAKGREPRGGGWVGTRVLEGSVVRVEGSREWVRERPAPADPWRLAQESAAGPAGG